MALYKRGRTWWLEYFPDGSRKRVSLKTTDKKIALFHALRVTFVTSLARVGAPLPLPQRMARHSTPSLTSSIYTRLGGDDELAAVERVETALLAASTASPTVGETVGGKGQKAAESCGTTDKPVASLSGISRKRRRPRARISAELQAVGVDSNSEASKMEAGRMLSNTGSSGSVLSSASSHPWVLTLPRWSACRVTPRGFHRA
jgi:hypothetical protein